MWTHLKSLEIIKYFNPHWWSLENPETGNLKNRDIMKGIPFYNVDYCMYSDWGYRKRTRIWTNKENWNALTCDGSGSCGNMVGGKHKKQVDDFGGGTNRLERYRVPEDLIYSLFLD